MSQQPTPPDNGDRGPAGGGQEGVDRSSFEGAGARASERIQLIVEAAEQAAAGIIDDAEAQAQQYLAESRARADRIAARRATKMWSLTDDLIERAENVRRQSDELLRALDEARQSVEEALRLEADAPTRIESAPPLRPEPASQPELPPEPPQAVQPPEPPPAPEPPAPAPAKPPSEGARLLATQMAVAGSTRDEIESRLQHEFGIRDTGSMLDAILGPGR